MNMRAIGNEGEKLARHFLENSGYTILDQNVHQRFGEIDLIAQDPVTRETVFVEVKQRSRSGCGHPEEFVDWRKRRHLEKAIAIWLKNNHNEAELRIDVIAIESAYCPPRVTHFKNISGDI